MSEVKPKRGRRERASRTQGSGKGSSKGNTASPIAKVENSSAEQGSWSKGSRVFAARERPDRNQQLQPGMVLLRGWLTMEQQQELVDATFVHGEGDDHAGGGFYRVTQDGRFQLNRSDKGRIVGPIQLFPAIYEETCIRAVQAARQIDSSIPEMQPTFTLVNFYSDRGSLGWHRDRDESSDRLAQGLGRPVVSIAIGDTADFGYRIGDQEHVIALESGDLLLFGGPARMMMHSLLGVKPGTAPPGLNMRRGRLNLTFRDHSGVPEEEIYLGYDGSRITIPDDPSEVDQQ